VVRTIIAEAYCPACSHRGLEYTAEEVDLPYLGKSLETLLRCPTCGYRHNDYMLTEHREPTRYMLRIEHADDMMARVVRSGSGTIRIPELGIHIEPGVASEAFVSNVEGVIVRVERVLHQLARDAEDDEARRRIEELQETFGAMREGRAEPVTLVLEDPFGNSAILADRATHERIPDEEADQLRVGMVILDRTGHPVGPSGQPYVGEPPGDDPSPAP